MTEITQSSIEHCINDITSTFTTVQNRIRDWIEPLVDGLSSTALRAAEVDALVQDLVEPALAEHPEELIGAGFVATPGMLTDAPWHLAWWLGARNSFEAAAGQPSIRRLLTIDDPSADGFRDYTTLEWWRVPNETGHLHVTGPYVDYLCTDDYTMTHTLPVFRDSELIGMLGADQYVTDIERAVMPKLWATGRTLTLVNASGRVVLSTEPNTATGMLLRTSGITEALASAADATEIDNGDVVHRCGDTTLWLIEHQEA